jgi:hypothetical protein
MTVDTSIRQNPPMAAVVLRVATVDSSRMTDVSVLTNEI